MPLKGTKGGAGGDTEEHRGGGKKQITHWNEMKTTKQHKINTKTAKQKSPIVTPVCVHHHSLRLLFWCWHKLNAGWKRQKPVANRRAAPSNAQPEVWSFKGMKSGCFRPGRLRLSLAGGSLTDQHLRKAISKTILHSDSCISPPLLPQFSAIGEHEDPTAVYLVDGALVICVEKKSSYLLWKQHPLK